MSLIHCLVARKNGIVLAEYTEHDGNFQQISRLLLRKLKNEEKLSVQYDNFQFHFINDKINNISFLCLSEYLQIEYAFAFISDVKQTFFERYNINSIKSAGSSYQLQEFSETIKELIRYYNNKPHLTKYGEQIMNLSIYTNVEVKKIEAVFQTEEKVNLVAVDSNVVKKNYQNLNFMEKKIKYQENYKKFKYGIIIFIGLIVLYLLLKYLFTLNFTPNNNSNNNNQNSNSNNNGNKILVDDSEDSFKLVYYDNPNNNSKVTNN